VLAATGYRIDLDCPSFLAADLRARGWLLMITLGGTSERVARRRRRERNVVDCIPHHLCCSRIDRHVRSRNERRTAMRMREIEIQDYARQLLDAHGEKAVAEAAQKAIACEENGEREDAETWRHVEAALKLMRGPHAS
jgi:hypothetical protein